MLSDWEVTARLLLAALAGSVIGFERERLLWAAGLRTHMLVCVGSCLIMIVSAHGFTEVIGKNIVLDPSRIAAQVVSGIGFLGAGTILFRGDVVRGLTTAASLWAVAGIGLAVGAGMYAATLVTTLLVLGILAGVKPLEEKYRHRLQTRSVRLTVARGSMTIERLREVVAERSSRVKQFVVQQSADGEMDEVVVVFVRLPQATVEDLAARFRALPHVASVVVEASPGRE